MHLSASGLFFSFKSHFSNENYISPVFLYVQKQHALLLLIKSFHKSRRVYVGTFYLTIIHKKSYPQQVALTSLYLCH